MSLRFVFPSPLALALVVLVLPAWSAAAPARLVAGPVALTLAADGTTTIVATVQNADGSLAAGVPLTVQFSSPCAATGTALLEASVTTRTGIASALYQPQGCVGADSISVSLGSGATALKAVTGVQVAAARALSPRATLGRTLFFDKALSASGSLACASCHAPAQAHLTPGSGPVPLGGPSGQVPGFRSAPSAAYAAVSPPFRYLGATNAAGTANNGANGKLGTPRGGLMWDGRAVNVADQARGPFTGPHEMANADSAAVLARLLTRPYLDAYRALFGPVGPASNADQVLANLAAAIGAYETEDKSFALFNSKFDAVQQGVASYTAQEQRGQAIFSTGNKGACAGCHNSTGQLQVINPGPQLFSDGSYRTLAVPRNWALPYNNDAAAPAALQALGLGRLLNGGAFGAGSHAYYDLGFCGPFRTDALLDAPLCGAFRVPGLRNVALKGSYFHNGVFASLPQVIDFYLNRDLAPQRLYLKADGTPDAAYNDLPAALRANREQRPPFTPLRGGVPRLTPGEVQDLVAFLCTLSDGYDPARPEAYRLPAQCRAAQRP